MTLPLVLLAVLLAGLVGLVAWRLARLPAAIQAAQQPLSLGAVKTGPLAQQTADVPWAQSMATMGPVADASALKAGDWYDPTTTTVTMTYNEYGFITSPSPAPVNPKTGTVPLTNLDVCLWIGHLPGSTCPRCGTLVDAVQPVVGIESAP